jgi:hypothetical protein
LKKDVRYRNWCKLCSNMKTDTCRRIRIVSVSFFLPSTPLWTWVNWEKFTRILSSPDAAGWFCFVKLALNLFPILRCFHNSVNSCVTNFGLIRLLSVLRGRMEKSCKASADEKQLESFQVWIIFSPSMLSFYLKWEFEGFHAMTRKIFCCERLEERKVKGCSRAVSQRRLSISSATDCLPHTKMALTGVQCDFVVRGISEMKKTLIN